MSSLSFNRSGLKLRHLAIVLAAVTTVSACTTVEKTATGTAVGAAVGAAVTGSVGGAVAGAVIGGLGTFLVETADGRCQYRKPNGQVVTAKCHWK